ncbi:MAG: 3-oxoacyl-ACP synthase, partial [bacterium]|nr:3-oxoacyl-ACP synthase [bacterium]
FGDGAGAVVLKRTESDQPLGILSTHIYSDGNQSQLIGVPGAIGRSGVNCADVEERQYFIKMDGNATFKTAVKRMCEVAQEALQFNGLSLEDVNLLVPHQANKRIIDAVGKKLGLPAEKVFMNIDKYGNTSAASIPIAIHEAKNSGRIRSGDLMLLLVVGAGLTWGAGLVRW